MLRPALFLVCCLPPTFHGVWVVHWLFHDSTMKFPFYLCNYVLEPIPATNSPKIRKSTNRIQLSQTFSKPRLQTSTSSRHLLPRPCLLSFLPHTLTPIPIDSTSDSCCTAGRCTNNRKSFLLYLLFFSDRCRAADQSAKGAGFRLLSLIRLISLLRLISLPPFTSSYPYHLLSLPNSIISPFYLYHRLFLPPPPPLPLVSDPCCAAGQSTRELTKSSLPSPLIFS